ncbi:inositol monophosphatase family protein [Rhodohalobacter sp. 8-1]|uniref:inositol monophosphatase family protein n=1 Tax=Rhodohalobacter sp. 8-1 TaxID=3131972 RepID=UPI0030EB2FAF
MDKDLDIALKAARAGVNTVKEFRDKFLNIKQKGSHDLVTDADFAAEKTILGVLLDNFPDDEVLAEETANSSELSKSRTWIVDPIDGTTNFAHNFPIFCVSVALWENREPKVGVVIEINRNEEFTAVKGEGAYLNGEKIFVSEKNNHTDAFVATGFPYNDLSLVDPYLNLFRHLMSELQGIRRPGAASYDLCCVACGRFDGFFEYSLHAWDVAAAALIIQEAGGVVTNWTGGYDWLFGERMVAGNSHIHTYLLEQIVTYIDEDKRKNVI